VALQCWFFVFCVCIMPSWNGSTVTDGRTRRKRRRSDERDHVRVLMHGFSFFFLFFSTQARRMNCSRTIDRCCKSRARSRPMDPVQVGSVVWYTDTLPTDAIPSSPQVVSPGRRGDGSRRDDSAASLSPFVPSLS
jgi:hypothetical protein